MTTQSILLERNRKFAQSFDQSDMPPSPNLNTMILTCMDARVDPAHVLSLELGDALVYRNSGGRVTQAFIDEVASLAALVTRITDAPEARFSIVLMQHTKCGAQHFANPEFAAELMENIGVDVSQNAITDQFSDLKVDLQRLKAAESLPGSLTASAVLYDVENGTVKELEPPETLEKLRA